MISRFNNKLLFGLILLLFGFNIGLAQNNGELLGFQGIATPNNQGVKAIAMGTNYTAMAGDLNSLFHNSAGLADIDKFQISFETMSGSREMWENKIWGSQSKISLLSPMLEGLMDIPRGLNYVTDDSLWDRLDELNPTNLPVLGKYHYERDAAKWIKKHNYNAPINLSLAVPVGKFVLAGSFNQKYSFIDYDRNDSYTSPDLNDRLVIFQESLDGEITIVDWSQYERKRSGKLNAAKFAVATKYGKYIKLGLGIESIFGESDDELSLDQIGEFTLWSQDFVYSNDTLQHAVTTGTSKFSGISADFGINVDFKTIDFGFSMTLPSKLNREWDYNTKTRNYVDLYDTLTFVVNEHDIETVNVKTKGKDELKLPVAFNFGAAIQVIDNMKLSIDMGYKPYKDADFIFADATQDSVDIGWANQLSYGLGFIYDFNDNLSLMGGYRSTPLSFIPWGAPDKEEGPRSDTFSCGFALNILHGRLDMAYEYRNLKYLEPAFNFLNFQVENAHNIYLGYTFIF